MKTSLEPTALLCRTEGILEAEVDGEVVLMSMERGNCYGLDVIGSEIWRALKQQVSLAGIQADCRARYAGDAAAIDGDVARLLDEMMEEGLARVCA